MKMLVCFKGSNVVKLKGDGAERRKRESKHVKERKARKRKRCKKK